MILLMLGSCFVTCMATMCDVGYTRDVVIGVYGCSVIGCIGHKTKTPRTKPL